ncbi:hypothetical protein ACOMHN_023631 [Nucella lapillus]
MADDSGTGVHTEAESSELENNDDDPSQKQQKRVNSVSRPPSSHITRVDEESSASDSGGGRGPSGSAAATRLLANSASALGFGPRSVETVDRGVGPTPLPHVPPPPNPPPAGGRDGGGGGEYPPVPPPPANFLLPPFIDPRNGLLDNPYGSPVPSDMSLLGSLRSGGSSAESVTQLASRIQWEQLHRAAYSYHSSAAAAAAASRRFSPASLPAALSLGSLAGDLAHHGLGQRVGGSASGYNSASEARGYLSGSEIRGYASGSDIPLTPGSGSITLPGSLEGSRLTSPRPSIFGGRSRKRALSHSPISDYLDIQSLTRNSEGSLHLTSLLGQHHSRSSSAASGSYGHLSAASLGTASPHPPLPFNPYFRHAPLPPGPPFSTPRCCPPG